MYSREKLLMFVLLFGLESIDAYLIEYCVVWCQNYDYNGYPLPNLSGLVHVFSHS